MIRVVVRTPPDMRSLGICLEQRRGSSDSRSRRIIPNHGAYFPTATTLDAWVPTRPYSALRPKGFEACVPARPVRTPFVTPPKG